MKSRDLIQLSAYLDGQLDDRARRALESRLASDADLRAALADLRQTRSLLRRLPQRRAPRNFTLTRRMIGLRPPLPRAVPVLRLASALAGLLFLASYAGNLLNFAPGAAMAPAAEPMIMMAAPEAAPSIGGSDETPVLPDATALPLASQPGDQARSAPAPEPSPKAPPEPIAVVRWTLAALTLASALAAFLLHRLAHRRWR